MMTHLRQCVAGLLALGMVLMPGQALAQSYFWWTVVDEFGRPYPSQTVSCSVYDLASHGAKELFLLPSLARHAGVLTTMPLLSDADSRLHFYTDSTSDVRVVCYYARGGAATDVRLSRFAHTVMIDRQGRKIVRIPYVTNATTTNSGVWLPQGATVRDVVVNNLGSGRGQSDLIADAHLDVGFAGNHRVAVGHALVRQLGLETGLWQRPHFTASYGGTGGFYVNASHRGGALAFVIQGHRTGDSGRAGVYIETPYLIHVAGGLEVTYTTNNTPGISGHLYILYDSYHTGVSTTPVGR